MKAETATSTPATVTLSIDGKEVTVPAGTSVWEAARKANDKRIPALCHTHEMGLNPVGVCRVCVVDILNKGKSGGNYAASCMRECEQGMEVLTTGEKLEKTRKTLIEVLLSDHPIPCEKEKKSHSCDLEKLGVEYGLLERDDKGGIAWAGQSVFAPRDVRTVKPADKSNFSIAIDHSACILCDRCVRACDEVDNHVIGRQGKGFMAAIGFDNGLKMADSDCVNCGECMINCPTGAITYSGFEFKALEVDAKKGERLLTPEEMREELPLIAVSRVNFNFLERSRGGVAIRKFNKGDIICEQGKHGRTAYFIKKGKVNVYVSLPKDANTQPEKKKGILERLGLFKRSTPGQSAAPSRMPSSDRNFIPIDAPVDLDKQKPIATMSEGALFGEASCINHQRRSATVRADENDTVVIEMTRNFLDVLSRNRDFRTALEKIYTKRGVNNHLRQSDLFKTLDESFLAELAERSTLVRYRPGDVICRQGEAADAFFIIRIGHVKVEETLPDGRTVVRRYLPQSHSFGEVGLLVEPYKRSTTCTALDDVEMVRITKADLDAVMDMNPGVREQLVGKARQYLQIKGPSASAEQPMSSAQLAQRHALMNDFFMQQIYQGQSLLVLDLERCTRCDECVKACAQTHNTITRLTRDGLRFDKYLVTTSCRSCHDPKCLTRCPVDSIHRKEGLPIIIENYCVGCGECENNCPYGNITLHDNVEVVDLMTGQTGIGRRAMVCDLDNCLGEVEEPSCVYACPHNAAERIDGDDLFARFFATQSGK